MSGFLLDTDHITLYQRGHLLIGLRVTATPANELVVTIISFEEQIRGRLAQVRRVQGQPATIRAYALLQETLTYFAQAQVLPFDAAAAEHFSRLRHQGIRVGPDDLRIAAIALANGCA